jgi:hypothetical protein
VKGEFGSARNPHVRQQSAKEGAKEIGAQRRSGRNFPSFESKRNLLCEPRDRPSAVPSPTLEHVRGCKGEPNSLTEFKTSVIRSLACPSIANPDYAVTFGSSVLIASALQLNVLAQPEGNFRTNSDSELREVDRRTLSDHAAFPPCSQGDRQADEDPVFPACVRKHPSAHSSSSFWELITRFLTRQNVISTCFWLLC